MLKHFQDGKLRLDVFDIHVEKIGILHFCSKVNAFAVVHTMQSIQVIYNMQQ